MTATTATVACLTILCVTFLVWSWIITHNYPKK